MAHFGTRKKPSLQHSRRAQGFPGATNSGPYCTAMRSFSARLVSFLGLLLVQRRRRTFHLPRTYHHMETNSSTDFAPVIPSPDSAGVWPSQSLRDFKRQLLVTKANDCASPLYMHEGNTALMSFVGATAVLFLFADMKIGLGGFGALLALGLLGTGAFLWHRSRTPIMTLDANGIWIGQEARALVPWTVVTDFKVEPTQINGISIATRLSVDLAKDYVPFYFSGGRQIKYRQSTNTLVVRTIGFSGMNPEKLTARFGKYWQGGLARAELAAAEAAAKSAAAEAPAA